MTSLAPVAIQDFYINGAPANGGLVFFYLAGTTTKTPVYTDNTGTTQFPNPVVLNARGEPQATGGASTGLWVPAGLAYKEVFCPATDTDPPTNPIWTVDNILVPVISSAHVLTFTGGPPTSGQWLGGEYIENAVNFPANFLGSGGVSPKTAATANFIVSIRQNGTQIGTATVTPSGDWGFSTSGPITLNQGDDLDFYAPASTDATIADFGLTLAGMLA